MANDLTASRVVDVERLGLTRLHEHLRFTETDPPLLRRRDVRVALAHEQHVALVTVLAAAAACALAVTASLAAATATVALCVRIPLSLAVALLCAAAVVALVGTAFAALLGLAAYGFATHGPTVDEREDERAAAARRASAQHRAVREFADLLACYNDLAAGGVQADRLQSPRSKLLALAQTLNHSNLDRLPAFDALEAQLNDLLFRP